jgi:anti-anti-sigma regulatory factor
MSFAARPGLSKVSPLPTGGRVLCVDAAELDADAMVLDALAQLALVARRGGQRLVVRGASTELAELIELAGLTETLGVEAVRPGSTPPRC